MNSFLLPTWRHNVVAIAATMFAVPALAGPLGFEAALQLAERNAPSLAADNARLEAARQAAIPAGELPDPKLILGLNNVPISGTNRYSLNSEAMTSQQIGIMQEVPNADKRHARIAVAQSTIDLVNAERNIERLKVRRETALAWVTRYTAERKLALFDELYRENSLLAEAVRARLGAGRGLAMDAILPRQEKIALDDRHDQLERQRSDAEAALKRWVGTAGSEPLAGDVPVWPITPATLERHLDLHPELTVFDPMAQQAEAQIQEAQAAKKSDWGVQLAYQRRGPTYSDMASVQFTFDLPVFAARRQDPQIASKRAQLIRIDAQRETTLREQAQILSTDLAAYQQLDQAVQRQQDRQVPLVQEKIALALAAYRSGQAGLAIVIAARSEGIDARLKLIDLEGQRTLMAARLHYAYQENK